MIIEFGIKQIVCKYGKESQYLSLYSRASKSTDLTNNRSLIDYQGSFEFNLKIWEKLPWMNHLIQVKLAYVPCIILYSD